jgi:hypothetical protein
MQQRSALRIAVWAAGLAAAAASWSGAASAADGITIPESAWPRWQARLWLGTSQPLTHSSAPASGRVLGASLLGDYYFSPLGQGLTASGFRATSGLVIGSGAPGTLTAPVQLGSPFSVGRSGLAVAEGTAESTDPPSTLPYIGLGYSRLAAQGGWGFSADLGLVAQNPSGAWQLGRALFGPARGLEDAVRQMRLSPVLQVGVRYTF